MNSYSAQSSDKFKQEKERWPLINTQQDEITLNSLAKRIDTVNSGSSNYRNGGIKSGTFFLNESSSQQSNSQNSHKQQQQEQSNKPSGQSRSSVSPSNTKTQRFTNKQEYDSAKKQPQRGSVSSENPQDQDDLMRNVVHKVEIDSEGVVQEKTYKQVMDQQNQRDNKQKEMNDKLRSNLIRVEETYDETSERFGRSASGLSYIKNNQNNTSSYNKIPQQARDNSNLRSNNANKQIIGKEKHLNYSYVSFDDNGDNFMTNQTEEQSEFNTKQSQENTHNNKNRFSSVSSSSTAIYQKKIDEISSELKEKISFLIALEEELLETKTQLNMQKLENSSLKERIGKLQKDNHLMQKQITQLGETIKNLEKASNSLVNQILFIKNNNESNMSKDHQSSLNNLNDSITPIALYHEYLNDIVKSNINLRCNLEELNSKYQQVKNQINANVFTHSSPISTRGNNALENSVNTAKFRNNFLKGQQENNAQDRSSLSPSNISERNRRSQSPIKGGVNIDDYEKTLNQSRQFAQNSLQGRIREIRDASEKFVNKYLKSKRRNCNDEGERQFFVELDNEFQLINSNLQKMDSYLEEIKFENELRVKNARDQFEVTLKEIESIKKIAEERNRLLMDQVKNIEQENVSLNKTVENYKDSLIENERGMDESRLKIETYQKSAEDYQMMLKQVNDTLALKNEELFSQKQYRDSIEKDLNEKLQLIKELKLENSENNQFIRRLQEQIIALQKDIQDKQDSYNKAIDCVSQIKEDMEKKMQGVQQDNQTIQNREKEYLEKEIKLKEKENHLLNELSQRDQIISNLQEQINEINSSQIVNKMQSENKNLKEELDNLKQIKREFENNFNTLQNQIMNLKSENKELKDEELERKLSQYEKYQQIETKLGLQQTDILLLIEKLPLAEQELQHIVELNQSLTKELNGVKAEKDSIEKQTKEWKSKFEKQNQEKKSQHEQQSSERDMLKDNIKQQMQMNQQLQKQNQTIMQNCEATKSGYSNLEAQIKTLLGENDLLTQKCTKLEDCLQLLVKERELIKKQTTDNKLKELSSSQQNVIQSIQQNAKDLKGKPLPVEQNQKGKREQPLKINTSKEITLTEQSQVSVSPKSRNSRQSAKIGKTLTSQNSTGNLNSTSNTNLQKQQSQQPTNNLIKSKQITSGNAVTNSIQSQNQGRNNSSHNSTNKNQSITSSQQIKQMQQYHAMQGIQQQQLASLSPMSQKKYSLAHQSVSSNASGKNPHHSISPKNVQRQNELNSKQQQERAQQIVEKENNGMQQQQQQEQSIKISQLIQSGNQFSNSSNNPNNVNYNQNNNGYSKTNHKNVNGQLIQSQNLRTSNQSSHCGQSRENSQRIPISNSISTNNIAAQQQNNANHQQMYQEDRQLRTNLNQDHDNTYSIEESQSQFTNRIGEKNQSQHDGSKINSEEGYSNTMYVANYYEDSNNQQWKIKSLRDHPYEIVRRNDKKIDQTFAEADQYEDFAENTDYNQQEEQQLIQQQQQERFEREIQQREQGQRQIYHQKQPDINTMMKPQNTAETYHHQNEQNIPLNIDQQHVQRDYGFQESHVRGNKAGIEGNQEMQTNTQYQMGQALDGFSFNNELQRGKFMFQEQLNNINFSDEAFQSEQYSFN